MKTLLFATAVTTVLATNLPAGARQPANAIGAAVRANLMSQMDAAAPAAVGAPRQWQYHYVGRHAHLEGYWAPVK